MMPGMSTCETYFDILSGRSNAHKEQRIIRVSASKFAFDPEIIRVKQGENIKLVLDNSDALHGLAVPGMEAW